MISSAPERKYRVLLIEDNPGDVFLLREMVDEGTDSRFHVTAEARNLEEGIRSLSKGEADVVLLDLSMPECNGVETFARARAAAVELPIIVLIGEEDEETAMETVHRGAAEYLVKGRIDQHLLHRALRYGIERARAEAELSQERYFFQTLLENIPDRIYFKDEKSRFIRINRALTRIFGLERADDAYGKTDADFYGHEHASDALADEKRVMETGLPILGKVEFETMTQGGKSWSLTTKLPLRDHQGRVIGTCGISREITEMKEMEDQLATERNLLRSVIDNVPDLIFLKDAQGHYLLDNAAHMRWVGASEFAEVQGRTVFDFFSDDVAKKFHEDDMSIIRSGKPRLNYEERAEIRGAERWTLISKIPWLDDNGVAVGLVCISRDITEQKRAQEGLKKANEELAASREQLLSAVQNLQSAHSELRAVQLQLIEAEKMKSIGRLAAGVAHEVKNPLAVIKMGVEFLSTQESMDPCVPLILKDMADAVSRADGVIMGLLDFSAPKQLDVKREDLNAIINNAIRLVRGEMTGAFEVELDLQPNLPRVKLDASKIGQVFINIFTNAIHAMGDRGSLEIRTYSKQLTGVGSNIGDARSECFRVGQTIVVAEIDDSGHGIPDDKLAKIFEPFFTTKPTGKGTGLGLSVAKTIVDLHGGTIDLRNLPDGGVRVTVMFQA